MSYDNNFYPIKILKIYSPTHSHDIYIEAHDVEKIGNKLVEKAGTPLTMDAYKKLFILSGMSTEKNNSLMDNPILDSRLISFNPMEPLRYICWYDTAQIRTMEFHLNNSSESITIYLPAVLYLVQNGELKIYALSSNNRPTLRTELFKMPLPNLNSEASFCWGNVKVKEETRSKPIDLEMKGWEKVVWGSQFDNYNGTHLAKTYKSLEKSGKRFPRKELHSLRKTLKDVLL